MEDTSTEMILLETDLKIKGEQIRFGGVHVFAIIATRMPMDIPISVHLFAQDGQMLGGIRDNGYRGYDEITYNCNLLLMQALQQGIYKPESEKLWCTAHADNIQSNKHLQNQCLDLTPGNPFNTYSIPVEKLKRGYV